MHRQHASAGEVAAERVHLDRDAARHFVNVLRLQPGAEVELFDGMGASATFVLSGGDASSAGGDARRLLREGDLWLVRVGDVRRTARGGCEIILGACISKGKRMDWTVEKAVELGASAILPIISDNCVVAFGDDASRDAHRERWSRIAIDAARQCSAAYVPEVLPPAGFTDALATLAAKGAELYAGGLVPDAVPLGDALAERRASPAPGRAAWLVGPEGDFSAREYDALRAAGARLVSLGDLVLRTETAAIYGLCVLGCEWGRTGAGAAGRTQSSAVDCSRLHPESTTP